MTDLSLTLESAIAELLKHGFRAEADAVQRLRESNASNALQCRQREGEAMDAAIQHSRAVDRVRALANALKATRPIVEGLIAAEYNIESWGLKQRLAAIDAALDGRPATASGARDDEGGGR